MPRVAKDYIPSYRLHRASGQPIVTLSAKDYLLGPFGSHDSRVRYHELIAQWLTAGRKPLGRVAAAPVNFAPPRLTLALLVAAYKRHVAEYYRRPNGEPTSEVYAIGVAIDLAADLFGNEAAEDFTPLKLKEVRTRMMARAWVRKSVNKSIGRVRAMFRWGVENELVPPIALEGLKSVTALKLGRCTSTEGAKVRPVPEAFIEAIKPHVAAPVWAIVQLQRFTGARGGELLNLRAIDIDTTGKLWAFHPTDHKTSHHGHDRVIVFGPRAQAVLAPFMAGRKVDAFLFDPRESVAERKAASATKGKCRRPDQKRNAKKTDRSIGNVYDNGSYRRAIQRACDLANVERWHPHRLRHNFATDVRKRHGIETARAAVGHKSVDVTEIYAERDLAVVEKIAAEIG